MDLLVWKTLLQTIDQVNFRTDCPLRAGGEFSTVLIMKESSHPDHLSRPLPSYIRDDKDLYSGISARTLSTCHG